MEQRIWVWMHYGTAYRSWAFDLLFLVICNSPIKPAVGRHLLGHFVLAIFLFKGYRPLPPTPGKKVRGRRRGKDNCEHSLCSRAAQSLGRESYEAISSGKKQKVMPKVTFWRVEKRSQKQAPQASKRLPKSRPRQVETPAEAVTSEAPSLNPPMPKVTFWRVEKKPAWTHCLR